MADFAGGAESTSGMESGAAASPAPTQSSAAPSYSQSSAPSAPQVRGESPQYAPQQHAASAASPGYQGQPAGVLSALRASGYDTSGFNDDKSFLSAINDRLTQAESYQQQIADYQRQLGARSQPNPGSLARMQEHFAPPATAPVGGWAPPQYDPRNDQFFRMDEQSRRWVPNQPNVPYELVQAKNDYMDYRAGFAKEWSNNPIDAIWTRTEPRNRALVREEISEVLSQMRVEKDTGDWLDKHKATLFVDGVIDHTGDPAKLTPAGQLAMTAADELDKAGVNDPATRRNFTEKFIVAELSKQYMQQQQDPAQRRYTLDEITQAYRASQGLPPQEAPAPQMQAEAPPPQFQSPEMQQQMQAQANYAQAPQGYPQGYPPGYPQVPQGYPQGYAPGYPLVPPGYPQAPQGYPQGYPQAATPDQLNEAGKRRFVGGAGHSSSSGPAGGATGEFVPQSTPGARPNFLNIANQIAQSRGIQL